MQIPPKLNPGDKVGIFVPSSPVKEPFRSEGLKRIEALGFVPVEVENILSGSGNEFLAKTPEECFNDIQRFFNDKEIKALWAARGGYGSNLLLPFLDRLIVPEPKIVIGSSDVSYLLWYLMDHFDMVVFYGPMAYSSLPENRFDEDNLKRMLCGDDTEIKIPGKTLVPGEITGIITGGCLSNLVSLLGTPYMPNVERRVLLLEDVNERPYRLDRMFWQLSCAGIFDKIEGLLLGEFPNCFKDEKEKETFLKRVLYYLNGRHIPVVYDMPVGHSDHIHTLALNKNFVGSRGGFLKEPLVVG